MPLELTNLPLTGLQVEQRGVFEAGANVGSGNSDIFLFPPRGTSGSLEEGDLTLETTEITRVRVQGNGALLSLSDSNQPDALNLSSYFGASGAGRDLTLYFVTALGMFSIPVENDDGTDGYDAAFGNTIRFNILDTTLDPGSGFGFDSAGGGFDQSRFLPSPYTAQDVLRGIRNGDRFIIAFARPIPRRAVEASDTLGSISAAADVLSRAVTRHSLELALTVAAPIATVAVSKRAPVRSSLTATATLAAITVTANVFSESPLEAAHTFGAQSSTAALLTRTVNRHSITAAKTFPAMSATTTVATRTTARSVITLAVIYTAAAYTAAAQARAPPRFAVTADTTYPLASYTSTIQARSVNRHALTLAPVTYAASSATTAIQTRAVIRHPLTLTPVTYVAAAYTSAVQTRVPSRRPLTAAETLPALSTAVTVLGRAPLEASVSYGDIKVTVDVLTRQPARIPLTAAATFGAYTGAAVVNTLEPRLTLADFDRGALRIDALALWRRTGTGSIVWNRAGSRFGGADVLTDGDIAIGNPDTPITRIRHTSATRLQLNDDGGVSLSEYFTRDEGLDATIWIQTIDGVASFPVQGNITTPNPNAGRIWFEIPAAVNTLLAAVNVTDDIILAITRPALRYVVEGSHRFDPFVGTASVQLRAAPRESVEAAKTLPAISTTLTRQQAAHG